MGGWEVEKEVIWAVRLGKSELEKALVFTGKETEVHGGRDPPKATSESVATRSPDP